MRSAFVAWLLVVVACKGHHEGKSERDTKGRSGAVAMGVVAVNTGVTAADAGRASVRDPSVVETGMVTLAWPGTIRQSNGKAPAVGAACLLIADVKVTSKYQPSYPHVAVTCGSTTLYDSNKSMSGTGHRDFQLSEHAVSGSVSVYDYTLAASDIGARTGDRNQYTVSTLDHELIVYREIAPTFRVTINVQGVVTRSALPFWEDDVPPFTQVVRAKGTLTSSKGVLPFTGKTCAIVLSPGDATYNCRVQMTCNGKIVFGTNYVGYETCKMQDGAPVSVSDTKPTPVDKDPELTVDMTAKTATLADELANGTSYSASFTLE